MSQLVGGAVARTVNEVRLDAVRRRDEMLAFQKQFSGDREAARFFKGEARDALKEYRAACLVLGWVESAPPGDSPTVAPKDWPDELAGEVRNVCMRALL